MGHRGRLLVTLVAVLVLVAGLGLPVHADEAVDEAPDDALEDTALAVEQHRGYTFRKVVDSAEDGFFTFGFTCSAINNRGDIAFRAARPPEVGTQVVQGMHRANAAGPQRLTTIAEFGGGFDFVGDIPSINDRGQVAFSVREFDFDEFVETQSVMRGDGEVLRTIADDSGDIRQIGFQPTVNNSGIVAFKAQLDSDEPPFFFDQGLFSGRRPSELTTHWLASTSDFSVFGPLSRASVNNRGAIAFEAQVDGLFISGVFVAEDGQIRTIAPATPGVTVHRPSFNDAGVVGFWRSSAGVQSLVRGRSEDTLEVIADNTGAFSSFGFAFGGFLPPALNNSGGVAFLANLRAGGHGVFVGDDAVEDLVIRNGDTLDGSVVRSLRICDEAINNAGEIAVQVTFDEFPARVALYRASPAR